MKIRVKPIERLLLAVYALIGFLLAAVFMAAVLKEGGITLSIFGYKLTFGDTTFSRVILAIIALAFIVWSIRLIVLAFKRPPKVDKTTVSVQNTENGAVRISIPAMDTLVRQAIGEEEGIVDVKSSIDNHEDSITVNIDMGLMSNVHIPNVTMLMQRRVKSFIEEYSGIAVREVKVLVNHIDETPVPGSTVLPMEETVKLNEPGPDSLAEDQDAADEIAAESEADDTEVYEEAPEYEDEEYSDDGEYDEASDTDSYEEEEYSEYEEYSDDEDEDEADDAVSDETLDEYAAEDESDSSGYVSEEETEDTDDDIEE